MIADRPHPQTLPLLPAMLCVLGAGWATGLVFQFQSPWLTRLDLLLDPRVAQVTLALLSALVGAWAIRLLLRGVCRFSITFSHAYAALVAGDLVSLGLSFALIGWATRTAGAGAMSYLPGLFGPGLLGLFLSVYLVQHAARPLDYRPPPVPVAPAGSRGDRYDEIVSAARDASLGLVDIVLNVPAAEVPGVVLNGIPGLELSIRSLEETACPIAVLAEAHGRLLGGLAQLEDDLVEAARQAGLSSMRYGWELAEGAGVKAVRGALAELGQHGLGTTW